MSQTILVVDDEVRYRQLLQAYLEKAGFRVVTAPNGRDALFMARVEKPNLILLDIMMPEMDGFEFMRQHRKERDTPVILLTAKIEEDDKVVGLELGADDYVTKPFSPRELTARVRAVLRRASEKANTSKVYHQGPLILDLENYIFTKNEQRIDLTRTEFDLLTTLMRSPNRAFTRLELVERIQGAAYEGFERNIDAHIKNIRAKIEANPRKPEFIETIYGIGYRFLRQ